MAQLSKRMSRIVAASKRPTWIALAVALVIQTGLISIQARRRIDTGFVRVWILDSLAPMEKLVDRSTYGILYVWDGYIALIGVRNENQRLKHQIDDLQMQLQQNHEDILELQRLRGLLSFQFRTSEKQSSRGLLDAILLVIRPSRSTKARRTE